MGCLHSLALMNSAAVNTGVQVSLSYCDLHSFGYMPRSNTGAYDSSVFSSLSSLHSASNNGYTNLHSHQQYIRVPIWLHPCQHVLFLRASVPLSTLVVFPLQRFSND
jgi:hypothetical protein